MKNFFLIIIFSLISFNHYSFAACLEGTCAEGKGTMTFPDGKKFGIKITYLEQNKPKGLPDAFMIGEKFIGKENVAMILGDNFFYGQNLTTKLLDNAKLKKGAKVVLHKVQRPELFGVAKIKKNNKIIAIKEKPKKYFSDLAITGLYF